MKPKPKSKPSKQSQTIATEPETTPSDFSFAVTRIAVAQICNSAGFKSTQLSALETLTRVTTKYLEAIAKSSASFAAASNRSQSNIFDITNALHDLRSLHGFSGASNLHRTNYCLLSSSILAELSHFVNYTFETPFAKPIPRWRFSEINLEKEKKNPIPRAPHIPNWLPELPDSIKCDAVSSSGRGNGEKLWENSSCGSEIGGVVIENGDLGVAKSELGEERGRVRFKIGGEGRELGMKNGVLRGGKRVGWDSHINRNGYN